MRLLKSLMFPGCSGENSAKPLRRLVGDEGLEPSTY
jgi:hypothetical protein